MPEHVGDMSRFRLAPSDEVAIVVGNQLRIANARFDAEIYGLRPYELFDELMEDLLALGGESWAEERKTFPRSYPVRKKVTVMEHQPRVTYRTEFES